MKHIIVAVGMLLFGAFMIGGMIACCGIATGEFSLLWLIVAIPSGALWAIGLLILFCGAVAEIERDLRL